MAVAALKREPQRKMFYATMHVTRVEEWCIDAESAEEACGYSRETGTTGATGIRSFGKQHMLFGPTHFCLMAKRSIVTRMVSPISTRSVTAGMIELFSYMHSISSSLTAATCAESRSKI